MDRLSDYDYDLQAELIAQTPLEERAQSKLLVLNRATGAVEHRQFIDVTQFLNNGDLLILNNTRVTAIRLFGERPTGGKVELLLLKFLGSGRYEAMAKPGKRLKAGSQVNFEGGLSAVVETDLPDGIKIVQFPNTPEAIKTLNSVGKVPLPPYIYESLNDSERYQTVYATQGGSSAAPTAGLHFTQNLLDQLLEKGVEVAFITLDVGIDTFRPVQSEVLEEHQMHGEICRISPETANAIARNQGRVVAVGTTTVRTLESMATGQREVQTGEMDTRIFIRPGFKFRVVDAMFTNFHLPRTTMLMMLAAFAGRERVFHAYEEAIRHNYRFLSFGDSMLII